MLNRTTPRLALRSGLLLFVWLLASPAFAQPDEGDADDAAEEAAPAAASAPVAPAADAPLQDHVRVYAEIRRQVTGGERGVLALPAMDAIVQGAAQFLIARAEAEAEQYGVAALHDLLCEDAQARALVPTTCDALAGLASGTGAPSGRLRLDALVAAIRADVEALPPNILRAVLAAAPAAVPEGSRVFLAGIAELLEAFRARVDAEEVIDRVFRAALACDVDGSGAEAVRDCSTEAGKRAQRSLLRAAMLARWALGGAIEGDAGVAFFRVQATSPRAPAVRDAVAHVTRTVRRLARAVRDAAGGGESADSADAQRARASAVGRQLVALLFDADRAARLAEGVQLPVDRVRDQARLSVEAILDPSSLGPNEALAGAVRVVHAIGALGAPGGAEGRSAPELRVPDHLLAALSTAVAIAAAQDAAAVRAILDQMVAPVGSWRGKRQGPMVSVTALVGVAGSRDRLLGDPRLESWAAGLHASIGLDLNLVGGSAGTLGFYLAFLDLGGVASVPFGLDAEDDQLDTDPDLLSVLSPGLYLRYGIATTPLVLAGGAAWVPRARQVHVTSAAGEETTQARDALRLSVVLAIDTTLWAL